MDFKIGVISDSFRLDPFEGIRRAAALGAYGVQTYAVRGEIGPDMPAEKRKELVKLVDSLGIRISALCGDTGRGFASAEKNPETLRISKAIVDLAVDVGTKIVTTHIGKVPPDRNDPVYQTMLTACRELADYAATKGVTFAVETGPEKAVHTHAKDGNPLDPPENGRRWLEVPLGKGGVPWPEYLKALDEIGYHGFLTIEREVGDDPAADIAMAADFLRSLIR